MAVASLPDFYTSLCYALPGEKKRVALCSDDLAKAWLPARGPVGRSSIQYQVSIPNAEADFQVENEWRGTYFVNYLRKAFESRGFPGWECDPNPPRAAIAELADGLLPI